MKYKTVLMFLLVSFIFTSTASAKINYNGVEITESHSATIRGFLYEMSNNALNVNIAQRWSPLFAKTLEILSFILLTASKTLLFR